MNKFDHIPVNSASGNIVSAGYDAQANEMQIRYKTAIGSPDNYYNYKDVPPEIWEDFSKTFDSAESSTGGFFHQVIRPNFPGIKQVPEQPNE